MNGTENIQGRNDYFSRQGITLPIAKKAADDWGLSLKYHWFLIIRLIEINRNC